MGLRTYSDVVNISKCSASDRVQEAGKIFEIRLNRALLGGRIPSCHEKSLVALRTRVNYGWLWVFST